MLITGNLKTQGDTRPKAKAETPISRRQFNLAVSYMSFVFIFWFQQPERGTEAMAQTSLSTRPR